MIKTCANPACSTPFNAHQRRNKYCSPLCGHVVHNNRLTQCIPGITLLYSVMGAREAADVLGITRNAFIGRAWRANITKAQGILPKRKTMDFDYDPKLCRFPIGDPRQNGFHYCGKDIVQNVYCDEHAARCFI